MASLNELLEAIKDSLESEDIITIKNGRKTVATAGTRERLVAVSTPAKSVVLTGETDNNDVVVVGGSAVVAALATREGTPIGPGTHISLSVPNNDLINLYLDSIISGEGVTYTYFN